MTLSSHIDNWTSAPSLRLSVVLAITTLCLATSSGTIQAQQLPTAVDLARAGDSRQATASSAQPISALQAYKSSSSLSDNAQLIAASDLPDAPDAGSGSASSTLSATGADATIRDHAVAIGAPQPIAPLFHKYIEPGQAAQPLPTGTKILFGFHQLESPYLLLTVLTAGAYEQAVNGSPNYGTDFGAYGQRVGAAAIRDASQTIFTDGIAAPIFHQDPRYYVMGNRRNALVRASYAVSRVLVTRADDGSVEPNYSLFSGYAAAAALNNAYYPADNRGFSETAKGFAGSLGGAAVSNVVREFLPTILRTAHLER